MMPIQTLIFECMIFCLMLAPAGDKPASFDLIESGRDVKTIEFVQTIDGGQFRMEGRPPLILKEKENDRYLLDPGGMKLTIDMSTWRKKLQAVRSGNEETIELPGGKEVPVRKTDHAWYLFCMEGRMVFVVPR